MEWEVEYTDQFGEWWDDLDENEQEAVTAAVNVLARRGPTLGRPLADNVKQSRHSNMKELIPPASDIRVLFAFDPRRTAILLIGGNKAGEWNAWYDRMVPIADDLFDEHLRELEVKEPQMPKTRKFTELSRRVVTDPERAQRVAAMETAIEHALVLGEIREHRNLSQADLANVLGTSQARVSQLENQTDLYLSTLKRYVEALGGELEVTAVFDGERIEIGVPA
jgi:DNA-binding transcriptional regulator YiaG